MKVVYTAGQLPYAAGGVVRAHRLSGRERLSYWPKAGGRGGVKTSLRTLPHSVRLLQKMNTPAAIINTRLVNKVHMGRKINSTTLPKENTIFAK